MRASSASSGVEAPRRADEQPRGLADAALVEGDLAPQLLDLRGLQRVDRPGLDRDQQLQRRVERAGVALRPRRGEQAPRAARRVGREHGRGLEERGGRGDAAARQGAAGRAFELLGDLLVGPGRRLGAVPGAPVGIELRIRGLGQRGVQRVPFAPATPSGRPPSARTGDGTAPARRSPAVRRRPPASRPRGSMPSRSAARHTSNGSPTGSAAASCSSRRVSAGSGSSRRAGTRPRCPTRHRAGAAEAARQLRGAHAPRQLQQGQRVAAGLRDDPLPDVLVEPAGDDRRQQGARVVVVEPFEPQLRQARRRGAPRSARGRRRRSPPARRAAGAPRTRAPAPRPRRATGGRPRGTAAAAPRPPPPASVSVARPTRKRSGAAPDASAERDPQGVLLRRRERVEAVRAAARRADAAPRTAAPSPTRRRRSATTRKPAARSAAWRISAVLPTPASPRMTSTPLRLARASSSSRSSAWRSLDRPRNAGGRWAAAMSSQRYPVMERPGTSPGATSGVEGDLLVDVSELHDQRT